MVMDMRMEGGCCRSKIQITTEDPSDPNIDILVSNSKANKYFKAIRDAWQNDVSQKGANMGTGGAAVH